MPMRLLAVAALAAAAMALPTRARAEDFLPDSVVLLRVGDRSVSVARYVDAYFASNPEYRPRPDSAGRVEFLESMVNQLVLGIVATEANRPLGFEDRLKLREINDRIYSNLLYQRAVLDSIRVTDDDVRKAHEQCRTELHLHEIVVAEESEAARLRRQIASKKIEFGEAARHHSIAREAAAGGDLGWVNRLRYTPVVLAPAIWNLKPGELSRPLRSREGYHLIRVAERRAVAPGAIEALQRGLKNQLRSIAAEARASVLQGQMAREVGLVVDTANVRWAAERFIASSRVNREDNTFTLEVNAVLPTFEPADTGRVLARWSEGSLSLDQFLQRYTELSPLTRPNINDYALFREHVVGTALSPYMPVLAKRRGLDRDPLALAEVARREEEIRVEHLYEDSVASRVWIRPEDRKAYYEKNRNQYVTYPEVRYAVTVRHTRAGIDSVAETLRAGGFLPDLIRADSLAGVTTGSVRHRSAADRGSPYYKVLFEELREGEFTVSGPDRDGDWIAIQLLQYVPERQLSYREAEHYVDESLTNLEAERLLKGLIQRHRARFRIEMHPELLMRIHLTDPVARS